MEPIKHISAALIATAVILGGQIQAQADWSDAGMHTMGWAPNHIAGPQRVESQRPQHEVQSPKPVEHNFVRHDQGVQHHQPVQQVRRYQPANHQQPVRRDDRDRHVMPGYFRRDVVYYQHPVIAFPIADVDTGFWVPDGFEVVIYNGETFYYKDGSFYQQVGNQLTAIPAVLRAVVDHIPTDYEIVMANDGVHYLFTHGVYYQRVDQGFEVVPGPGIDQE